MLIPLQGELGLSLPHMQVQQFMPISNVNICKYSTLKYLSTNRIGHATDGLEAN